ncbi:MAG: hypothetical protein AB1453_12160 [Chloroflexota bacterium]|jgi:hypothetical protein
MRAPLSTAIAISVGIIVLAGAFLPVPILQPVRQTLLSWAIPVAAAAGLVAIVNLLGVHWRKLNNPRERDNYSIILLLGFIAAFAAGILLGPSDPNFQKIVTHIQFPVEASLMGVLTVSLTYASIRMFQRRIGWLAILFAGSTVVFLIVLSGFLSIGESIPLVKDLLAVLNTLPVAGARGILLGIALGSLTTGLRILIGADRPYSG